MERWRIRSGNVQHSTIAAIATKVTELHDNKIHIANVASNTALAHCNTLGPDKADRQPFATEKQIRMLRFHSNTRVRAKREGGSQSSIKIAIERGSQFPLAYSLNGMAAMSYMIHNPSAEGARLK